MQFVNLIEPAKLFNWVTRRSINRWPRHPSVSGWCIAEFKTSRILLFRIQRISPRDGLKARARREKLIGVEDQMRIEKVTCGRFPYPNQEDG
jgi:hypothetical protein